MQGDWASLELLNRARGGNRSRTIAATAIFTAFVAATTMAFSVYIPATRGYFDIGEILVFVTALLMGPYVGAFAGGVGSAISDAVLAPVYAPGTLVIKGLEGLIVGYLANLPMNGLTKRRWIGLSSVMGLLLSGMIVYLGTAFLSGSKTLYLGFSRCAANCSSTSPATVPVGPQFSASFFVPEALWIAVGVVAFAVVLFVGTRPGDKVGWTLISILAGGSEMVTGYFLFESFALGLGVVTASVEVPINVGQVVVGLLVAIPIVRSYRRAVGRTPFPSEGKGKQP